MTLLFLLLLMLGSNRVLADSITVETDRQNVEMGDIITLAIETDFQTTDSKLDLSLLEQQFDVLNKQQSNQISIVNGHYNSHTIWRIQILPKQAGKLVIPPFEINGVKSQPYPITVKVAQYTDANRPYFLEAEVDKSQVYVQEQLIYTLRFYHKGSLISGNIRPPKFDSALVESLKEQSVYGKTINGQQYTVYEWQYALFPQSSGELKVSGPSFTGILHLKGKQKGVQSIAKDTLIQVRPAVKGEAAYWLPATSLSLSQQWQNLPDKIRVGDSLRRIITLEVDGLKDSQLPNMTSHNGDHYKVYADEAVNKQTLSEKGVHSSKLISQAIVPTQAGTLTLPDEKITWWNTATNRFETRVLKSKPLTILPAEPTATSAVHPESQIGTQSADQADNKTLKNPVENPLNGQQEDTYNPAVDNQKQAKNSQATSPFWVWIIAGLFIVLWLITLWLLLHTRKQLSLIKQAGDSLHDAKENAVTASVLKNKWCDMPPTEFYKDLLRQLHDDINIKNVDSIPNEPLKKAIFQLEAHLFAGEQLNDDTKQIICDNWASLFSEPHEKLKNKGELSELYNNK
ncbi:hypothetical protein THMIRHAM_00610 [Thiomicrorhabdus immobilis]|uniref:Protein BatD n=1 Tax=Thiomicrorhabdus immobilis TaxID=2791037 RepID=A0ABN6CTM3_9GAMM|nr:hypothetical protein THMIRHAM_00610 [Thiomicrorhabdus immobilis]